MDGHTEKNEKKNRVAQRKSGRPYKHRVLALILVLAMVLALPGIQTQAETTDAGNSTVAEEVVEETSQEATETQNISSDDVSADNDETETQEAALQMSSVATLSADAVSEDLNAGIMLTALDETDDSNDIDLSQYLTDKSTMKITVTIDGKNYSYTPEELTEKNLTVPKGAPVKVELYFDTIYKVEKGQKLVFQLPDNLMDYSGANDQGIVWSDIVWEENLSGAEVEAADWIINENGELIVTIRDDFFDANKHSDGTVDLFGFNVKFSGSFSSERGEHSGNDDNVISFRGETDGTGKISFTIPFEYKNEHANVKVEKRLVNYDTLTQTASYEIQAIAPDTNSYAATNVVVTDLIQCDASYIVEEVQSDKSTNVYRNYVASTGEDTFNNKTGVWTIGDMTPGQTETLTYDVVISKDAYASGALDNIDNLATVTFNDDGENQDYATLELPDVALTKEAVEVSKNDKTMVLATDEGGTYATYKLSVTANDGDESNIKVVDTFDNASRIKNIVVVDADDTSGTFTIDKDDANTASLTWTIDLLKSGTTATLTYKAYLNDDDWHTQSRSTYTSVEGDTQYVNTSQNVKNNAILYIGSDTDTPTIADSDTTSHNVSKTWVKKNGQMMTSGDKKGLLKYTVEVNGDPISDKVTSIYDTLKSGGTYESGGVLTVNRYTSSDSTKTLVDTTEIPLSEIVTADGSGYRWDLDLVARNLNGAYFYVITYYVSSSGVNVANNAGIGFGVGPGYAAGISIVGGGGMTYGSDYSKSCGDDNNQEGYTPWTVTVKKTIPSGAVYEDKLSNEFVYVHGMYWFDDKSLAETVITFDGKTLVQGEDYTITGVRDTENGAKDSSKYDPEGKKYSNFLITFNKEFAATSSNPLVISYKQMNNVTAQNEDFYTIDGCTALTRYNYCRWGIPEYGKVVFQNDFSANWRGGNYTWNTPLAKGDSTYNADDGTITWYVTVNQKTSVGGDATLEEYLPEGLSFVSAEISNYAFPDVTQKAFQTKLGDITQEEYTDDNGKTCVKVNIPIKDLVAYYVQSSRFADKYDYNVGPYTGWSRAGEITVKIVTKVDTDWYMNLSEDTPLTNKAVLTDNSYLPVGGISATGTATVPHTELIDKSMVGKENPAYLEYALNINPDGSNLSSGDTLEIVDIMGSGMSLSTDHSNFFKVYDVTNVTNLLDSDGNIDVAKAATGADVTDQCMIENITGQELDGMTEDEVGKPAYLMTVPDGTHLVILYWATFEGAEGETVAISNKASFFYNNAVQSEGGGESSDQVVATASSSTMFTGPFLNVSKTDQWNNSVKDATYELYKVSYDASGTETRTLMMTKTTGEDGTAYFGHRTTDGSTIPELSKGTLYCLVETGAPVGYVVDDTPYYFEFRSAGQSIIDHPSDITVHQLISGATCSFTNTFKPAAYMIPVKKTLNGKDLESTTEFSFRLKQTSGSTVYTDEALTQTISSENGIQATITGSGETEFDMLYFREQGTYVFELTEDDLSDTATKNGYSKDSNTFTVTIMVGENSTTNKLTITSAKFTSADTEKSGGDLIFGGVPVFDNVFSLKGTLTLNATKIVNGRTNPAQDGEFKFTVSVNGKVIPENGTANNPVADANGKVEKKIFTTESGGSIKFEIPIDQDDIGTYTYVISEVEGDDDNIDYTSDRIRVKVTIAEDGNGGVTATKIEYPEEGAVFTNEYHAKGSIDLTGSKVMKDKNGNQIAIKNGEFTFTVKEGDTVVATGKTVADSESTEGSNIQFDTINYVQSDIGTHHYTITEDQGKELFVEYDTNSIAVTVNVTDNGNGTLNAVATYPDDGAVFNNLYTFVVPSGIPIDFLPYIVAIAIVAGGGTLMLARRRKGKRNLLK